MRFLLLLALGLGGCGDDAAAGMDAGSHDAGPPDAAMPDGSGLWLAALGIAGRELIWRDDGFTIQPIEARAAPFSSASERGIM